MTKRQAREILQGAAYAQWAEDLDYARQLRNFILADDAQNRLRETLYGIEDWLDAVYDQGHSPEDADFVFLGSSDRVRGLGYRAPSQVLALEASHEAS
jgi:hypothetical protein